ncbi:hypothetical protein U0070_020390 [Myodes glareolus]|uniref:Uncharacterized protein n=1 Tax=Myodes glareolus TaxID=447135 RepID=A0AAW0JWA4_MYOGA
MEGIIKPKSVGSCKSPSKCKERHKYKILSFQTEMFEETDITEEQKNILYNTALTERSSN